MVLPGPMSATPTVPGYTVTGVAGIGSGGAVHRARDGAGREVALRVLAHAPDGLLRRARLAARVHHPGLARVAEPVRGSHGSLAVVTDFIPGPTLATLRAARRGLAAAECVQVLAEVLAALQVLHAAGIVHGDVSPANIILAPGETGDAGRLVLVDLVGGAGPDRGTRGFRAPELHTGAAASAVADVYSAAQVCLWLAEPGARREVAQLVAPLLAADPEDRPSAFRASQLLDGVPRVPVQTAPTEVLASATLREHAAREPTTRARTRRPRGRRRHRAHRRRWLARVAVAVLVAVVALGTLRLLSDGSMTDRAGGRVGEVPASGRVLDAGAARTEAAGDGASPAHAGGSEQGLAREVASAVRALLTARDAALAAGDAEALSEVTVPGSALATTDAALLSELAEDGVQLRGYRTEVLALDVTAFEEAVDPAGTGGASAGRPTATVRVELRQRAHERIGPAGVRSTVPAQPVHCLELVVQRSEPESPGPAGAGPGAGWRAVSAAPC